MSEAIGDPSATAHGTETHREAYSFACLSCGHGWEQEYEIQRRTDLDGRTRCVYLADGVRVPSPLTNPSCPGCGGSRIRIMRAGRVAEVDVWWHWTPEQSAGGSASASSATNTAGGSASASSATNTAPDTTPPRTGPESDQPHHPHHRHLHLPHLHPRHQHGDAQPEE